MCFVKSPLLVFFRKIIPSNRAKSIGIIHETKKTGCLDSFAQTVGYHLLYFMWFLHFIRQSYNTEIITYFFSIFNSQ